MGGIHDKIIHQFGNRLRTRVSGICIEDDKILLVKHNALGPDGILWAPPGGGMHFGTTAEANLIREFKEETGLIIRVEEFLFVHEFLSKPLHAIELFFRVKRIGGALKTGTDPEMHPNKQIIAEVKFYPFEEIHANSPSIFHNILNIYDDLSKLREQKGYLLSDSKQ